MTTKVMELPEEELHDLVRTAMNDHVCTAFVSDAIVGYGPPVPAVQAVLDVAGFNATALRGPVFGGLWRGSGLMSGLPCEGIEAEEASAWLEDLTSTMQRGKFEYEVAHVYLKIQERKGRERDGSES